MTMRTLFVHPHFYAAAVMARIATIAATAMWALIVLVDPSLFDGRLPGYLPMMELLPPRAWAIGALTMSTAAFTRLALRSRPRWYSTANYVALSFFWDYILVAALLNPEHVQPPAGLAAIVTIAALSLYAFGANPKPPDGNATS
jgi:hypothetical protein